MTASRKTSSEYSGMSMRLKPSTLAPTAIYLLMGWIAVVALQPLYVALGPAGLAWLLAGGVSYSLGVFFFATDGLRYRHFVWHLFVLGGSVCHLVAVAWYAGGISH